MKLSDTSAARQRRLRKKREANGLFYLQKWVPVEKIETIEWFIELLGSKEFDLEWLKRKVLGAPKTQD